ncbi:12443_t:CDS:2 [Entrophospora sp. SA101]|nr:12443_t:CDS:2 [Entrophospora sp. SA101]
MSSVQLNNIKENQIIKNLKIYWKPTWISYESLLRQSNKFDAGKSSKVTGNHKNDIDWIEPYWKYMIVDLFPENKYLSEEAFCETGGQVLAQRQPECMQLMIKIWSMRCIFHSAISSTKKCENIGVIELRKPKLFYLIFPNKFPKFNSKTDPIIISEFKKSDNAKWCLHHLNSRISAAKPTKYIVYVTASFTKDQLATDNDQYFNCCMPFYA